MHIAYGRVMVMMLALAAGASDAKTIRPSFDSYIRDQMAEKRIAGLGVAVIRHGRIEKLSGYGNASLEYGISVSTDTLFHVASISKSFTSVAIMTLVEAGKLRLDDPVGTYIADLPASWRDIPVRRLLNHTSGLPDIMVDDFSIRTIAETSVEAIRMLRDRPLLFASGTDSRYNQTAYMLLAMIIEKLSGQAYAEYCAERLFKPLKLVNARFGDSRVVMENRATVYTRYRFGGERPVKLDHTEVLNYETGAIAYPAGGLNISTRDFATWLVALLNGDIISRASLEQLWTPATLNDGTVPERPPGNTLWKSYGLGWVVAPDPIHPLVGGTGGLRAAFFIYPTDNLAVIVLTNTQGSVPEALVDGIAQRYLPEQRLE